MLIALAYHRDLVQAFQLVRWISGISRTSDWPMTEPVLLIPSAHAASLALHKAFVEEARKTFPKVTLLAPEGEHETGWPGACNFMFQRALFHVEQSGEDLLWLEPDAVPVTTDWIYALKQEWEVALKNGKLFMGTMVEYGDPHMSGIGVYSAKWRKVAPSLGQVPDEIPWDVFAAPEILPNAHFTPLVQHVNWQASKYPYSSLLLEHVDRRAVIFHQDKEQKLMGLLDSNLAAGVNPEPSLSMSRCYFLTSNQNKVHKAQGFQFMFQPLDMIGGSWRGTLVTENESEIVALRSIVAAGGSVKELTEEQFLEETKKKAQSLPPSNPQPTTPASPRMEAQINPVPARLVEAPSPSEPKDGVAGGAIAPSLESVLLVGRVKPPETAPKKGGARRTVGKK